MTRLTYILLFTPLLSFGQASNAPEIIFPMVEQFISEAHARKIPTYHKIRAIDSIGVEHLEYPFMGLHDPNTDRIKLHNEFFIDRHREKVFLHEIGHAFGLKHVNNERDIMCGCGYNNWFNYDRNWLAAKEKFYNDLKNML